MLARRAFLIALAACAAPAAFAQGAAHPAEDYRRAEAFLRDDKYDEATYWYYRGRYRMTAHLAARPATPAKEGADVLWAFDRETGDLLRKIAYGNIRKLVGAIDRVLREARSQDDAFTPKAQYPAAHEKAFAELKEIRDRIWKDRARIRADRARDGLVNR
jgi:hypothetical protein